MKTTMQKAYLAWAAAEELRRRRGRYKRYTYGDQWSDLVTDEHGSPIRESEQIARSGKRAITNNLIRQLVKSVVGRYRTHAAEHDIYADVADLAVRNDLAELDSRLIEEFLISGCAVQRIVDERRFAGRGVWVDNVDPRMFFVNAFKDPRGLDIDLVGMLHDMSFAEIVNRFGAGSRSRVADLRRIYGVEGRGTVAPSVFDLGANLGADTPDSPDFFRSCTDGKYRVIEVWTFDSRPARSGTRMDFAWHCRYFAPDGFLLAEHDSPYPHGSHPFAIKFYPLTDGEVHPFVEDVIDQQRHINRLIVLIDHILAVSAKGVLLFPMDQMAPGVDWEYIQRTWARADGIIPVNGRGLPMPQQVVTGGANSGAYQLLQLQMKLFEDISGVGDALMGRASGASRGAEMYDNQVRNASMTLTDIFETFASFAAARNAKALRTAIPAPRPGSGHRA